MNKKEIEELIRFVSKSGVSEVSLEQKDFKITIKNATREVQVVAAAPAAPVVVAAPAPVAAIEIPCGEITNDWHLLSPAFTRQA